jgi:hypothetical protein
MATIVDAHDSKEVATYVRSLLGQMRQTRTELVEAVSTIRAVNKFLSSATEDPRANDPRSNRREIRRQIIESEEEAVARSMLSLHHGMSEFFFPSGGKLQDQSTQDSSPANELTPRTVSGMTFDYLRWLI